MQMEEVNSIIQAVSSLDITNMELQDQLLYLSAGLKLAEMLKPLVIKYADKLPQDCKFLVKL